MEMAGEWERLKDFITAQSLFDHLKMAVVDMANNKWQIANGHDLKDLLEKQLETKNFYLVISADDAPPKEFNFLLKKPVLFQEFKSLTGLKWKKFMEEEVGKRHIAHSAWHMAVGEGDVYGLINELDKVELVSTSGVGIATPVLRGRNDDSNKIDFFSAIQRLAKGNLQTQLPVLERLLNNEDAGKIFNILAYSVDAEKQVKMADYDVAVKSGKLEYEEALLNFVLN